jgi:hypothetical protein
VIDHLDQLDFYFAVHEIERRLGLSRGAAQAKLREFCASGVVRSWKRSYLIVQDEPEAGQQERILPSEWRSREVDLVTDAGGYKNFVDVSKADLDQQIGKDQADCPRDAEIIKQLRKGLRPGETISWKEFCELIRKACNSGPSKRGFSDETIENVARKILREKIGQIG